MTGDNCPEHALTFEGTGLRQLLLDNVRRSGYTKPTPVQKGSIPVILARRDLIACAQTGSGKTAAYLLPVLHVLLEQGVAAAPSEECQAPQVVVVAPTRELAIQVKKIFSQIQNQIQLENQFEIKIFFGLRSG